MAHGASAVPGSLKDDVVAATLHATNGRGADVVFDCAGVQSGMDTAFAAVRSHGNIVIVAVWETTPTLPIGSLSRKEITMTGESYGSSPILNLRTRTNNIFSTKGAWGTMMSMRK